MLSYGYVPAQEKFMKGWNAWESGMIREDLFIGHSTWGRE